MGPYALRRFSLVLFSSISNILQTRDQSGFLSPKIQHSAFEYQLSTRVQELIFHRNTPGENT